jgi:O-antigen ligase
MGVLYFIVSSKDHVKSLLIIAVSGGVAVPIFICFAPTETVERLLNTREALSGDWTMRKEIATEGVRTWTSHPIAGTGIGTFKAVVGGIHREGGGSTKYEYAAHNAYLALLVEVGVVGLGLFITIMIACLFDIWQFRQPERNIWLVIFAGWAVGVYALAWECHKPTWLLFAMIAAQHGVARRQDNALPQAIRRTRLIRK